MSAPVKKSFSWLWMIALLITTIGVSVQQMYCYCLGETTTSLSVLTAPVVPVQEIEKADCCQKKVAPAPASCCAKKPVATKKAQGCAKKTTKVFQLKAKFLVDKPVEKSFDFPLWINDFPLLRRMSRPVICDATIFRQANPPPPVSGRDLCLRHHLARC